VRELTDGERAAVIEADEHLSSLAQPPRRHNRVYDTRALPPLASGVPIRRAGGTSLLFRDPLHRKAGVTVVTLETEAQARLSDAQRRVLVALCRPFKDGDAYASPPPNQQIAEELFLGVDTVKTHLRALFARFEIEDLPQNQKRLKLVEIALKSGVVSPRDL
jgi:Bacterial regulatory proteins, luxR family